jgi:hypothetical protein
VSLSTHNVPRLRTTVPVHCNPSGHSRQGGRSDHTYGLCLRTMPTDYAYCPLIALRPHPLRMQNVGINGFAYALSPIRANGHGLTQRTFEKFC